MVNKPHNLQSFSVFDIWAIPILESHKTETGKRERNYNKKSSILDDFSVLAMYTCLNTSHKASREK